MNYKPEYSESAFYSLINSSINAVSRWIWPQSEPEIQEKPNAIARLRPKSSIYNLAEFGPSVLKKLYDVCVNCTSRENASWLMLIVFAMLMQQANGQAFTAYAMSDTDGWCKLFWNATWVVFGAYFDNYGSICNFQNVSYSAPLGVTFHNNSFANWTNMENQVIASATHQVGTVLSPQVHNCLQHIYDVGSTTLNGYEIAKAAEIRAAVQAAQKACAKGFGVYLGLEFGAFAALALLVVGIMAYRSGKLKNCCDRSHNRLEELPMNDRGFQSNNLNL